MQITAIKYLKSGHFLIQRENGREEKVTLKKAKKEFSGYEPCWLNFKNAMSYPEQWQTYYKG